MEKSINKERSKERLESKIVETINDISYWLKIHNIETGVKIDINSKPKYSDIDQILFNKKIPISYMGSYTNGTMSIEISNIISAADHFYKEYKIFDRGDVLTAYVIITMMHEILHSLAVTKGIDEGEIFTQEFYAHRYALELSTLYAFNSKPSVKNIMEEIYNYWEKHLLTNLKEKAKDYSDIRDFWRDYWYRLTALYAIREANNNRVTKTKAPIELLEDIENLLEEIISEKTIQNAREQMFSVLEALNDKEKSKMFTNKLLDLNEKFLLRE